MGMELKLHIDDGRLSFDMQWKADRFKSIRLERLNVFTVSIRYRPLCELVNLTIEMFHRRLPLTAPLAFFEIDVGARKRSDERKFQIGSFCYLEYEWQNESKDTMFGH
jgi:hypothetical protein